MSEVDEWAAVPGSTDLKKISLKMTLNFYFVAPARNNLYYDRWVICRYRVCISINSNPTLV